jgi:hypothetical protein
LSFSALWLINPRPRHSKCGRSSKTWASSASAAGLRVVDRQLERDERRVHEPDVRPAGLGLEQGPVAAGYPHHVAEGGEDDAGLPGQPDRVIDPAHRDHAHRAPGPVDQLGRAFAADIDLPSGISPTAAVVM